jgi:hypothetical protein
MKRLSFFLFFFFTFSTVFCGSHKSTISGDTTWVQCQFPSGYGITGFGVSGHELLAGAATVPYPLPYAYIFLSTDSGLTWKQQASFFVRNWIESDSGHIISQIRFTPSVTFYDNGATLFAGISQVPRGAIYRSTDNGITWSDSGITWPESDSDLAENINCFYGNGDKIFAGTGRGVFVSTNNGTNWSASNIGLPNGQYDSAGVLHAPDISRMTAEGTNLFAATWSEGIFCSTDNGRTWTTADSGLTNINTLGGIATVGTKLFVGAFQWANDSTGGVFVSADSGQGWSIADTGLTDYSLNTLLSDGSYLFTGTNGGVFASTDTGATWRNISIGTPVWAGIGGLAICGPYLLAQGGGVWRYLLTQLITGIKGGQEPLPSNFILSQNYPNPFNPTTIISYQLPMNSIVTLKIYDVLGRGIETLVNNRQSAGSHSVTFNASSLSSGVYFYKLEAGNFIQTKKLVVIK